MTMNDGEPADVRTLAQLYAESLDRWTPAEVDFYIKMSILRRLPVEMLRAIAGAETECEALELYARYGG